MKTIRSIGEVAVVYNQANLYPSIKEILDTNIVITGVEFQQSGDNQFAVLNIALDPEKLDETKQYTTSHKQILDVMGIVHGKEAFPVSCAFISRGRAYYVTNPL